MGRIVCGNVPENGIFVSMADRTTTARVQRLEELKGLLRARDSVTASELADELGISLRTLWRDLDILRDSGVPIESDRGRGGGLRMQRTWSLGRLHLSAAEAIDLLLSIAIAERMNSPMMLQQLGAIRRKIVIAFADAHQPRIRALRHRILIGPPATERVTTTYTPGKSRSVSVIANAFFNMERITIEYADRKNRITSRDVQPQYLYLTVPVWYLLAWDELRDGVRAFRIDRIKSAVSLGSTFRLADSRLFIEHAEEEIEPL